MTIKLITHDRIVHADDTFAAAILRIAHGNAIIERTRDPEILQSAAGAPDTFLLDVGGQFDPERRLFDHHQPEGAGFRNKEQSEWPYATAGLVWKYYGAQAVRNLHPSLDEEGVAEIVQHIDDTMLKYIDAVDCGVRLKHSGPSLSAIIGSFNSTWYEREDDVFPLVLQLAEVILSNFVKRYAGKVFARDKVRQSQQHLDGRILVLDTCLPWVTVVAEEMPDVKFVVYPVPDADGTKPAQWQLRAAVNSDRDMTPRIKLPQRWGGLERTSLSRACGEREAVFCHRSLHLAGAQSLDAALYMAESAIREQHRSAQLQAA